MPPKFAFYLLLAQLFTLFLFSKIYAQNSNLDVRNISYTNPFPKKSIPADHNTANPQNTSSSKTSGLPSVLSSGSWFKIAVLNDGIYKIDKNFLNQLGVNTSDLDPRTIRLFGKGGGMLPQSNAEFRYKDLPEMAIYVEGENDAQFNDNDFIQFFGESAHKINYNSKRLNLKQENHLYCDTSFYFLNIGQSNGKRITTKELSPGGELRTVVPALSYVNEDKYNLLGEGRLWFGDKFDLQDRYAYQLKVENPVMDSVIEVTVRVAARAGAPTTFTVSESGSTIGTIKCDPVNINISYGFYADLVESTFKVPSSRVKNGILNIEIKYNKISNSTGWLDYINVRYYKQLMYNNTPLIFYSLPDTAVKSKPELANRTLKIESDSPNYIVWNVSNPVDAQLMPLQVLDSGKGIKVNNSFLKFIVFGSGSGSSPISLGKVENQDLHSLGAFDYAIITHPLFREQANRLAELHRNEIPNPDGSKKRVVVIEPQKIYNEFGSGAPDISAIRDFIKYYYDLYIESPNDKPKYVLLFGDGSYDSKGISNEKPKILSYNARQSLYPPEAYTSDDFYGLMNEDEGFWGEDVSGQYEEDNRLQTNTIDVVIGRLPANSQEQAKIFVDKIYKYVTDPASFGSWSNSILLIGDAKASESNHIREADGLSKIVNDCASCYDIDKVYLDSYPAKNLAEGIRYPEAKQALLEKLQKGQLLVNYTGHGSELGLSNAYIFEKPDMDALTNAPRLPFWVTATCEFGRYDDTKRISGAENLILNPNGGAIGILTSVREVFSDGNERLNQNFYRALFCNTGIKTIGDAFRIAKNNTTSGSSGYNINTRNFALLCDPALYLSRPTFKSVITSINKEKITNNHVDTIKALEQVNILGEIQNNNGILQKNFNGEMEFVVYDKKQTLTTLTYGINYDLQNSIIFKGRAIVKDGMFDVTFVTPLDISYEIGMGKINMYAHNGEVAAGNCFNNFVVCCTSPDADKCITVPAINLYIDAPNWKSGSLTGASPKIYAQVSDDMGINTTGGGIGRDLSAILNDDVNNPIVLNSFYLTSKDDYKKGTIIYPFQNLPAGEYKLSLKVWNVCNNAATAETRFKVIPENEIKVEQLNCYPNPVTSTASFIFNHNKVGQFLDVNIYIYTIDGRLVRNLQSSFRAESSISQKIEWDGTDDFGNPLANGVYLYKFVIRDKENQQEKFQFSKLILQK